MNGEFKKKNKRLTIIASCCILTLIAAISGATYAFFTVTTTSNQYIYGSTGFKQSDLDLSIVKITEGVGEGKLIPLKETNLPGIVAGTAGNAQCVDSDNNNVCQIYSITITNNSPYRLNISGTLTLEENKALDPSAVLDNLKWAIATNATTILPPTDTTYNDKEDTSLGDFILEASGFSGNSKTYYVVIWINEVAGAQNDTGKFKGTVNFSGYMADVEGAPTQGITSAFTE